MVTLSELERTVEEVIVTHLIVLSRHSPEWTKENKKEPHAVQSVSRPRFQPGTSKTSEASGLEQLPVSCVTEHEQRCKVTLSLYLTN
jgi:hypothetical protein